MAIDFPNNPVTGDLFTDVDGIVWVCEIGVTGDSADPENVRWVRRGSAIGESLAIGAFMNFGGATAPAGYLVCDGASYKKTDYPDLYAAIGDLWANTGSVVSPPIDEFRVPPQDVDGLGLYLRGDGDSTIVGAYQGDVFKEHDHEVARSATGGTGTSNRITSIDGDTNSTPSFVTGDPIETRPRSITTLLCIKATFSAFTGDLGNIPVNSVDTVQIVDGAVTSPKMDVREMQVAGLLPYAKAIYDAVNDVIISNDGFASITKSGNSAQYTLSIPATNANYVILATGQRTEGSANSEVAIALNKNIPITNSYFELVGMSGGISLTPFRMFVTVFLVP